MSKSWGVGQSEFLKSTAEYRVCVRVRSEILSGVNEAVMKLLADNAWSIFDLKSKMDSTLSYVQ